jgi:hypothetical protein
VGVKYESGRAERSRNSGIGFQWKARCNPQRSRPKKREGEGIEWRMRTSAGPRASTKEKDVRGGAALLLLDGGRYTLNGVVSTAGAGDGVSTSAFIDVEAEALGAGDSDMDVVFTRLR